MSITKLDLASKVSKKLHRPVTEVKILIDCFIDEILKTMAEGERIEIRGFGAFKTKIRQPRIARNPRTGESVEVPSFVAPIFKFSKEGQKVFDEKLMQSNSRTSIGKKRKTKMQEPEPPTSESAPVDITPEKTTVRSAENFSPV